MQSYSPVRELRADQVLSLGSLLTEMGERELYDATLTNMGVLAHLGSLTEWSPRKVNFSIFHPYVKLPEASNSSISARLNFSFFR